MADQHDEEQQVYRPLDGVFTPIARAQRRPPSWVVEGLLPPGFVLLVGPPKDAYKSTLIVAIAAEVAGYGQTVLPADWKVSNGGPSLIFSHEDDAGEIKYTAEEGMGIELRNDDAILIAEEPAKWRLDEEESVQDLLEWFDERQPRLIVTDPLANSHSVDEKDSGGMIRMVAPFRRWAKENDATWLVVHHPRKLEDERAYRASDIRGSGALFGACDGALVLTPTKNRLQVEIAATFKKHPGWIKTIDIAAWEKKGERGKEALKPVDHIILKVLRNGAKTLEDVARDSSLQPAYVSGRIKFLMSQRLVRKNGKKLEAA